MAIIIIKKLTPTLDAEFPTAPWSKYKHGEMNPGVSLPVAYAIKGTLIRPIRVGRIVVVLRTERNGVSCPGHFQTSIVLSVTDSTFSTANSVYSYSFEKE